MRRLLLPAASLALMLCMTAPSHGWFFHHPHGHYLAGPYAAPMAAPLSLGFTIPGGYGVQVSTQQPLFPGLFGQHGSQSSPPAQVTVASDVKSSISRIATKSTTAADNLDKLIETINKGIADPKKQLSKVDRTGGGTTSGSGTNVGSGEVHDKDGPHQ